MSLEIPYVNLYGWNIDIEEIKRQISSIKNSIQIDSDDLEKIKKQISEIKDSIQINPILDSCSPVLIATAAAGISHQEKNFEDLRTKYRDAEKMKDLGEKLVVMGHSSIIEHMYFNFDIVLTRLGAEFLEAHRLLSLTEKSQRFTKVSPESYFLPESLKTPKDSSLISRQIELYQKALSLLTDKIKQEYGENWKKYESSAKEDARFCLPLIIAAPIELSVNGRELEYIAQKAASHPLIEMRKLSQGIVEQLKQKVPFVTNLIKYTSPDSFYSKPRAIEQFSNPQKEIYVEVDPEADNKILATLLFEESGKSYEESLKFIREQNKEFKINFLEKKLKDIKIHQRPQRAFESAYITVSAPISASCYAQLKRHRIMTLITQDYNPALGYTIPDSIEKSGLKEDYQEIMNESSKRFLELSQAGNPEATYILTNGHKRLITMILNMRELYHFSRLRQDEHAQWEIRDLANIIVEKVKLKAPITSMLLCGKDKFAEIMQKVYNEQ